MSLVSPRNNHVDVGDDVRRRVEPQLKDLMGLYRQAALMPSWSRSVRANQSGGYLSALKGRGMEYDESRPYQPGDDIRTLDWRVTARTGKPHTKVFREERERPVYVCSDLSPSMQFATQGVFKSVQCARAAALIAWKAQQTGDRVGGLVFGRDAHHELPPERGKPGVIRLLKKMVETAELSPQPASDSQTAILGETVSRLNRMAKPGSLIFLLSDFRDLDEHCESDLARLARHNDLSLVFIYDPLEAKLPTLKNQARVTDGIRDIEIAFGDNAIGKRYSSNFEARYANVAALCKDYRILLSRLATFEEPLPVLQQLLGIR